MLHILGMIGKGIGIALLCILILVVALLLALLFVPIRYYVRGKLEANNTQGIAKAHWLFHIVTAYVRWEDKLQYGIKIFGCTIYGNQKKQQKPKRQKKQKKQVQQTKAHVVSEPKPCAVSEPEQKSREKQQDSQPDFMEEIRLVSKEEPSMEEIPLEKKESGLLTVLWEKIKAFCKMLLGLFQKVLGIPSKILEKLRNLKQKAENIKEIISAYQEFFQREDFKRAFALCKRQLLCVWKNIRPRKVKADIHFGFDDPAVTGQILAYLGMLYPLIGKDIAIRPDFEEVVCEGKLLIRGKITIFVLLRALWILYFDKDIKRLIRIWKKEDALHGRK